MYTPRFRTPVRAALLFVVTLLFTGPVSAWAQKLATYDALPNGELITATPVTSK